VQTIYSEKSLQMVNEGGTILGSSIDAVNEVMSSHED
jgi:hypothetical protein